MNGSNRPRRRPSFGPKPVNEGEVYNIEIEGVGTKGDGIGRVKGFVVIIPGVSKGEKVDVKITAVRGKVAFGEKVSDAEAAEAKPAETEETSESAEEATEEVSEDTPEESPAEEEKKEDTPEEETSEETADTEKKEEFEEK